MRNYYVYGLFAEERIPELFYIGKGSGNRLNAHFTPSAIKAANAHKQNILLKYKCKAVILSANLTENEAFNKEIKLIHIYQSQLVNITVGGEGYKLLNDEFKLKVCNDYLASGLSITSFAKTYGVTKKTVIKYLKNLKITPIKITRDTSGISNSFYGKKHSEIYKAKRRLFSKETQANIANQYYSGLYTRIALANTYNCSLSTIKRIIKLHDRN